MNTQLTPRATAPRVTLRSALKQVAFAAALSLALAMPRPATAANLDQTNAPEMVMVVDGIAGNSPLLKGAIDITNFNHGITAYVSETGGGGAPSSASVELSPVYIIKHYDKSTPLLMAACASGKRIPKVDLYVRTMVDGKQQILAITLEDVFITSIQSNAGPSDNTEPADIMLGKTAPTAFGTESLTLQYVKISQTVLGDGDPVSFSWDLSKNTSL